MPGGIAGPPCPGDCKYGGLALQVGGWVSSSSALRRKASTPIKYNGILTFVPGIFLIVGTLKTLKPHVAKTLLSFSGPRDPTSVSVKRQLATATSKKYE